MEKIKILYVEDEPYLGKIVKESLESRGFEVRMESDGLAALPAFRAFGPHLCVLDVMLPKKDGFSIGQDIRALNNAIPIIYLTAKTQTEDVLAGFRAGGNDYIRKPFSLEELIARIHNLLQIAQGPTPASPASAGADERAIGRYTFNLMRYELRLGDKVQKLSHREAELLRILAEHRNQTVQRRDILQRIWGDDSFFNSRNLDVYIKKLRDYLREDDSVEIITLKGVGYHFSVAQ
ncbi:MAG: response regulator transcription factor [Phaeodactylibacter sp.]|nr:response regulator transcription factor [Phaeodactylibacter sp.]MCB9276101.1 response regulator transcription factor [Lewinellaceae bacterium]